MKTAFLTLIMVVYGWVISTVAHANGKGYGHHERFGAKDVIITLGILTLICMIATFLMGYFMPKSRKLLFIWHKRAAIATMILAFSHGLMVLLFH